MARFGSLLLLAITADGAEFKAKNALSFEDFMAEHGRDYRQGSSHCEEREKVPVGADSLLQLRKQTSKQVHSLGEVAKPVTQDTKWWQEYGQDRFFILYCAFWVAAWMCVSSFVYIRRTSALQSWKFAHTTTSTSKKQVRNTCDEPRNLSLGSSVSYPSDRRVIELFEQNVKTVPSEVALVIPGTPRRTISYSELGDMVQHLSSSLLSFGIGYGAMVALVLDRSVAQVVAILGVLQAGAAFQPIDHEAPIARITWMLADSDAAAVITVQEEGATKELVTAAGVPSVVLTCDGHIASFPKRQGTPANYVRPDPDSMALLIYTSGTTGTPKGIVYDERHLMHGVHFFGEQCNMGSHSVSLLKSPYFWAVMEWEFFPALTRGGKLVVSSPKGQTMPAYLANTVHAEQVDVLVITPQVFDLVLDVHEGDGGLLQSLRNIVTVGEPLFCSLANRTKLLCPQAELHNFYGASESSCTIYTVPQEGVDLSLFPVKAPAGRPQPHASVYLMKETHDASGSVRLHPVDCGEIGEICFGGVLAARYWKNEEKTAEKWIETADQGRLYRTGDTGRWSNGQLEIIGRLDRQVNINGVRIEPEESEAVLKEFVCLNQKASDRALKEVAVVASDDPAELVAFVSLNAGIEASKVTPESLREHCSACLTTHYAPRVFLIQESLPRLPNGKLDLAKLRNMATENVAGAGEVVRDSLGEMKTMSKAAMLETTVSNRCYAYWMAGVVFDHFFACYEGGCVVLMDEFAKPWTEAIVRSIGNDQDLFGFIMVSAHQDSLPKTPGGRPVVHLGKKDLYVCFIYLLMGFPIPQIVECCLGKSVFASTQGIIHAIRLGAHRWYLYMYLAARFYLAACHRLHLPGWAQGLLMTAGVLALPNHFFETCRGDSAASRFTAAWVFDSGGSSAFGCPVYQTWKFVYVAIYVWCFHYLRPFADYAVSVLPRGPCWSAAAFGLSMVLGMYMALYHYPNPLLERGEFTKLIWLELTTSLLQPALLVLAMTHFPIDLSWWGGTTLGTYVMHFYFRHEIAQLFRSRLSPGLAADPTGIGLLLAAGMTVLFFSTIVGPLIQHPLLLPMKLSRA
eukprot:TRINITY_DN12314_c1_g4_i1.p1 TRINITY_DN12314_c1_g4~~TRINITY_DN12314_c1_g4_i1.p1  ORF type:complete len:1079 (+),score=135.28 TRINITY_DN12314_c1_g4_i1:127-3363(+)